jgi:hypothetical protein
MEPWLVASLIKRYMKSTRPGAFAVFDGRVPDFASAVLGPDETPVGWYQNPPPSEQSIIIFTTKRLLIIDLGSVVKIKFDEIVDYEPPKSKTSVTGVRLTTKTGPQFVRIEGAFGPYGHQRDAFSFIMLLRALIGPAEGPVPTRPDRG